MEDSNPQSAPAGIAAEQLHKASIISLPSELIHQVLSYLPSISLYAVSLTCSHLKEHCDVDRLWEAQVSQLKLVTPSPYPSYKTLHDALAPRLFLPRKIFIGDRHPFGFVVASIYNSSTGSIEIYPLIEDKRSPQDHMFLLAPWSQDPRVFIYDCNPRVRLWEEAEVKISPFSHQNSSGEIPQTTRAKRDVFATYFPARATLEADVRKLTAEKSDDGHASFWPPAIIPSEERVRIRRTPIHHAQNYFTAQSGTGVMVPNIFRRLMNAVSEPQPGGSEEEGDTPSDQPTQASNPWSIPDTSTSGYISNKAFNVKKWTKFENHRPTIETYFELEENLWTPTPDFPLRGIFIGDYSAHGNEFLLFHQTAGTPTEPPRLEAIKLTGDPNVPRGKHTFIIDDLTPSSAIRVAPENETEWPGASIYGGRGQIAMNQFGPSQFIDVEVIIPAKTSFSIVSTMTGFQIPIANAQGQMALGYATLSGSQLSTESESSATDGDETTSTPALWIKQEVAVYWKGIGGGIRRYKRIDVDRFFA